MQAEVALCELSLIKLTFLHEILTLLDKILTICQKYFGLWAAFIGDLVQIQKCNFYYLG